MRLSPTMLAAGGAGALFLFWERDRIAALLRPHAPPELPGPAPAPAAPAPAPGSSPEHPLAVKSSDAPARRVPLVAERLTRLWKDATGEATEMPAGALELALAQAWLESGMADKVQGSWWKGAMEKSGNLGAIQCAEGDSGGSGYTCVAYTDKHPDKTEYTIHFRFYDSGDSAAKDFLHHIAVPRTKYLRDPHAEQSFAALKRGDLLAYAKALYNQRYYEGFGATDEERIAGYARGLASHLPAVASALGHDRVATTIDASIPSGKHAAVAGFSDPSVDPYCLAFAHLAEGRDEDALAILEGSALEGVGDEAFDKATDTLAKVPMFGLLAPLVSAAKSGIDAATGHDPKAKEKDAAYEAAKKKANAKKKHAKSAAAKAKEAAKQAQTELEKCHHDQEAAKHDAEAAVHAKEEAQAEIGRMKLEIHRQRRLWRTPWPKWREKTVGDTLAALHLSGVLPRARSLPSGELIWYLEDRPSVGAMVDSVEVGANLIGDAEIAGAGTVLLSAFVTVLLSIGIQATWQAGQLLGALKEAGYVPVPPMGSPPPDYHAVTDLEPVRRIFARVLGDSCASCVDEAVAKGWTYARKDSRDGVKVAGDGSYLPSNSPAVWAWLVRQDPADYIVSGGFAIAEWVCQRDKAQKAPTCVENGVSVDIPFPEDTLPADARAWLAKVRAHTATLGGVHLGAVQRGPKATGKLLPILRARTNEPIQLVDIPGPDGMTITVGKDNVKGDAGNGRPDRLIGGWLEMIEADKLLSQQIGQPVIAPSKRIVDAIYAAAPIKTVFHSQVTADPASGGAAMHELPALKKQNDDLDQQIRAAGGDPATSFSAGGDKYWMLSPLLAKRDGDRFHGRDTGEDALHPGTHRPVVVNYGGHDARGHAQQMEAAAHDADYPGDSSQAKRVVLRYAKGRNGERVDLLDWIEQNENVPRRYTDLYRFGDGQTGA